MFINQRGLHDFLIVWLLYRPDGHQQNVPLWEKEKYMETQRTKNLSIRKAKTVISHLLTCKDDITDESHIDCETNCI